MKMKLLKKEAVLVCTAVIFGFLSGCGISNDNTAEKETGVETAKDIKEMVYAGEELVLEGLEGNPDIIQVEGNKLYIRTTEWTDAEGGDEKQAEEAGVEHLYCVNLDGSDLKELTLPERMENEQINEMFPEEDGNVLYVYSSYDDVKGKSFYFIVQADENGNISVKKDITETLELDKETYINDVLMDEKSNLVFVSGDAISVIDKTGKQVSRLKSENHIWLEGAAKTKDGQLVVGYNDNEGACIQMVDIEEEAWGKKYNVGNRTLNGINPLMDGEGDYDIYFKDNNGIYGYTFRDNRSTGILDYSASDISSDVSFMMFPIAGGKFLGKSEKKSGDRIFVYHKVDASAVKEKKTIYMSVLWSDEIIEKAVSEFNQNNDQYRVEIKKYSDIQDPEARMERMNADIIAGNVADIICLKDLPVDQYISKGLLEDLTPYYEKDDEINPDDMVDSLREAIEVDGKFYYVTPSFTISTLVAATADVGTKTGWTFEEMKSLLEEKGDEVRPFASDNKRDLLGILAENASADFVDWITGECSFDSQEFKDILEFCNKGTNDETEEYISSIPLIQEGKVLFSEGYIDYEWIQTYKKIYNGEITLIGYPDVERKGSYFSLNGSMGIYSRSEVKDGAWEFLRTLMTKDFQCKAINEGYLYGMPSRKDAVAFNNKAAMALEPFTDEYGVEHTPREYTVFYDNVTVDIQPSSQHEIDIYMDLINHTKRIGKGNKEIFDIIEEESQAYFSGDKSLDETADIIQNRVKIYVSENR